MTSAIYHTSPETLEFTATVESVTEDDDRTVVTLDQTAFYPEGGGQPADQGTLNGCAVTHVRKDPDAIRHIVSGKSDGCSEFVVGQMVSGAVDPGRRRDYMQQHTGQHLISAALLKTGGFNTVSVHLGADYSTIEVDAATVSAADLDAVELLVNQWIEDAIPVTSTVVAEERIAEFPLRRPPKVGGSIRLVIVEDVDCAACGGVHVDNTNKVRLVRHTGTETIRGNARLSWKIGDRAIADYKMCSSISARLGDYLSSPPEEIVERVQGQEGRLKETEANLKRANDRIHQAVATDLVTSATQRGEQMTITAEFDGEDREFLRGVSKILCNTPGVAACLTNRLSEQLHWSIVLAPGVETKWATLKEALFPLIDARGGGKPPVWQGMGTKPSAAGEFVAAFAQLVEPG